MHKSQLSVNIWCALYLTSTSFLWPFGQRFVFRNLGKEMNLHIVYYMQIHSFPKFNNQTQGFPPFIKDYFDWQTLYPMTLVFGRWVLPLEIEPLFYWLIKTTLETQLPCLQSFSPVTLEWRERWTNRSTVGGAFRTLSTVSSNLLLSVTHWTRHGGNNYRRLPAMKMSHVVFTETTTR